MIGHGAVVAIPRACAGRTCAFPRAGHVWWLHRVEDNPGTSSEGATAVSCAAKVGSPSPELTGRRRQSIAPEDRVALLNGRREA